MKKKIFIASHTMEIGGAERALLGLLNSIDFEKYDVDLFLMHRSGPFFKFIPKEVKVLPEIPQYASLGVPLVSVIKKRQINIAMCRLFGKIKAKIYVATNGLKADNGVALEYSHKYTKKYMPVISDTEYDFAISFLTPHYFVAEKVTAKMKAAWIHTDYSYYETDTKSEEKMWSAYDYIMSISDACTKGFCSRFPSLSSKIRLMENIISPDFIRSQANESAEIDIRSCNNEFSLLSIGRFTNQKNFDNVPYICKHILEKGINVKWYLIGFGHDEQLIKDTISQLDLQNNVIILGKMDNPYPYIKMCDVYVQPSRYEGKAVTVREAQCLGKPVIITDYPTAGSQLTDGFDGIVVPLENEKCASEIVSILKNTELLQRIAKNTNDTDYSNDGELDKLYQLIN